MDDVDLFWRLETGRIDASDAEAIARIGDRPFESRVPILGALDTALEHTDDAIRSAGVRVLAGCDGRTALFDELRALGDEHENVRVRAVTALHESALRQPMRWAHALFHSSGEIRAHAIALGPPAGAEMIEAFLLADPVQRAVLLSRPLHLRRDNVMLLLTLEGRGQLRPDEALALLRSIDADDVLAEAAGGVVRPPEAIKAALESGTLPAEPGRDGLDALFSMVARASEGPRAAAAEWLEPGIAKERDLRKRVAASLVIVLERLHLESAELMRLLVIAHPPALGWSTHSRDLRRSAALALLGMRDLGRLPRDFAASVLADLVPRPPTLDLRVAAAVLALVDERPFSLLADTLGIERVVAAFVRDPFDAAVLLGLYDESKRGREWFVAEVAARSVLSIGMLNALSIWVLPLDRLDFVEKLVPHAALALAIALVDLEGEPRVSFRPKRIQAVAPMLAVRLTDEAGEELGRRLLTRFIARLAVQGSTDFGLAIFGEVARRIEADAFAQAFIALGDARLEAALPIVSAATRVPFGKELALAAQLVDHPLEAVRLWAIERAPGMKPDPSLIDGGASAAKVFSAAQISAFAKLSASDLERAVASLAGIVHSGLTDALARRADPAAPSLGVCVALLGSNDSPEAVARELERYRATTPAFLSELDARAVAAWSSHPELPLVGAAWLWCWERQAFRVGRVLTERVGGVFGALGWALTLPSSLVRLQIFRALGRCFEIWAARNREALVRAVGENEAELVELFMSQLGGEVALGCVDALLALHASGHVAVRAARPKLFELLPDLDEEVRHRLDPIVSASGLIGAGGKKAERRPLTDAERLRIRSSTDLDELVAHACGTDLARAEEAVLRLVELGSNAVRRLADLIVSEPAPDAWRVIVDSLPHWPAGEAVERIRTALDGAEPELRFRVALGFVDRGEKSALEIAIAAANAPATAGWFRYEDWLRLGGSMTLAELARRLARSPHPHAYRRAVEALMALDVVEARAPLHAFLAAGTERLADLRLKVAEWLHARGDEYGFPLRLTHALGGGRLEDPLFFRATRERIAQAVTGVLRAGARTGLESKLCELLEEKATLPVARAAAYERLLLDSTSLETARKASNRLTRFESREGKLRRVAEVFAWGMRIAPVITGRRLRVHMTGGRMLGYTRLQESHVYVTPMPILRLDRNADEVVEGLVLHELGHHRHHAGPDGPPVWKKAEEERIFGLLNLVADEHLERNLRALDESFGNRFKKLAAYAFQHSDREIPVRALIRVLGADCFAVLSTAGLSLAYAPDSVSVQSGALLAHMERLGSAFARFMRALRMGLGNRHDDPIVAEALSLFGKRFRHNDMNGLLEVARKLRSLFGWDAALAESFGGHEIGPGAEREHAIFGENIEDEEVQREVERVIDPEHAARGSGGGSGKPGKLWINVSGTPDFERIHEVLPLDRDPAAHRALAVEVARHSKRLRRFLADLGLARVPTPRRLRGTRIDQSELQRLVLRGDPRVLIRREIEASNDLFIGVAVDCSGSMSSGHSMDKAKRFAVLLAEAARGLPRVDLRVFGFTDRVIYDAGDAMRSAASSLSPSGGNNDAAGLLHVAEVAKRSARSARLLVMVSDGLPTECSTDALKKLAERLERREKMCVAQVAVQPLEEQCFRHYVLVEDDQLNRAVGQFGRTVARLVRRAMA